MNPTGGKVRRNTVGQTYGRLTVLEEIPGRKGQPRMVRCQCQCGKVALVKKASMLNGKTRSCGCYRRHRHEEVVVGRRFGKLLVLGLIQERSPSGNIRYKARCLCDCGNTSEPFVSGLLGGTASSCGCRRDQYAKTTGERSSQFTGYKGISGGLWSRFVRSAKRRHLAFAIDLLYVWGLFEQQGGRCAFTGIPIIAYGPHPTASLDRIDPTQGYIQGNVQWVHKVVNIMRNVYSVKQFVKICLLVAHRQGWHPAGCQELPDLSW